MNKKSIWIIIVLLIIAGCFLGWLMAANKPNDFSADEKVNSESESLPQKSVLERERAVTEQETESFLVEKETVISEKEIVEQYYGVYEIKEYYPGNTESRGYNRLCNLPGEEADLLIGQKIVLTEDKYVAYDNFRFGGRSGDRELSDYQIKRYVIDNPEYTITEVSYEHDILSFDGYPENSIINSLEYPYQLIELPNQEDLAESSRMIEFVPHLFVMDDCRLMWCCQTCNQWFIIEKVADAYEEEDISLPPDENGQVPAEMYGSYKITDFYPTVYWESRKAHPDYGRGYLSPDDVQSMIGRTVFLGTKTYQGYSFDSSAFVMDPPEDTGEIITVDSKNTNYLVRDVKRSELYGLRDSILPELYEQDTYKEITVPLSTLSQDLEDYYFCSTKYYQLDEDDNKILMLFMKEFFLLEKIN